MLEAEDRGGARARGRAHARRSRSSPPRSARSRDDVDSASARLDRLEDVLALHQRKLDRLNQLYRLQTRKLVFLQRQHKARDRAPQHSGSSRSTPPSPTSALTVVLEAASFSDMLDQLEFLNDIGTPGRADRERGRGREAARCRRRGTRRGRRATQVAETTRTVAARTAEQRAVRDRLAWSQRQLATARRDKRETLATVQEDKEHALEHMRDAAGAERRARSADPLGPEPRRSSPRPTGAASAAGLRLAGARRPHERLRLALGPDARGDRHRRRRTGRPSSPPRPGR